MRENSTIARVLASPTFAKDGIKESEKDKETDAIKDQLEKLSAHVVAVVVLTSTLEAQHAMAQSTIRGLEGKLEALEGLLRQQLEKSSASSSQDEK